MKATIEEAECRISDALQRVRRERVEHITGTMHFKGLRGEIIGCCAVGALLTQGSREDAGLSGPRENALTLGWDGKALFRSLEPWRAWWAMGRRLARQFKPVAPKRPA